jgi:hypothetical protein
MDVSTASNANVAISAYTTQQTLTRTRQQDPNKPSTDNTQVTPPTKNAKADQVNFTNEALRLSAQANQTTQANNAVNQANGAENGNQFPPQGASQQQAYQVSGAQSVAQAIDKYHNTFKI